MQDFTTETQSDKLTLVPVIQNNNPLANRADRIIELMKFHASKHKLPINYKCDLEIDCNYIRKVLELFPDTDFIWGLRDNGTCISTLFLGGNYSVIDYYLNYTEEKTKFFRIYTRNYSIEVLRDSAVQKIIDSTTLLGNENYSYNSYNKVMQKGYRLGLWSFFNYISEDELYNFDKALAYFSQSGNYNKTMVNFIKKWKIQNKVTSY
jgi:hypothetical protein